MRTQSSKLYWIHSPSDMNILSQGYVGVTNNMKKRVLAHLRSKEKVGNYLRKYGEYQVSILFEGDERTCLALEHLLRQEKNIGLNVAIGGGKPPAGTTASAIKAAETKRASGYMEEFSRLISDRHKKSGLRPPTPTIESQAKGARTRTGRKHSQERCSNISRSLSGIPLSEEHKKTLRKPKKKYIFKDGDVPHVLGWWQKNHPDKVKYCRETANEIQKGTMDA